MQFWRHTKVAVDGRQVVARRDFLRGVSAAGLGAGLLTWSDLVTLQADELRQRGKACILLWMQGGPSQFETFDPKPGHANGGETKAIATSVSGLEISDNFPKLATMMQDVALVRSMTTKEGNHQRASFLLHTAHVPTASVHYPTMGSVVSHEIPQGDCELPSFVRVGRRFPNSGNGGLLGTAYDPFLVQSAAKTPDNAQTATDTSRYQRRLGLLNQLEASESPFADPSEVASHRALYTQASKMILSPQMEAFDLARESQKTCDAYGAGEFASGCLLARRLIETGVTFVEVGLGNWDTHDDNFNRSKDLAGELDQPFAALIRDLKDRDRLKDTLIVWMGEFGRTPKINPRGGRDHYPRAFNVALAGCGIRGGQVIGRTDAGGVEVADRPVTCQDLFRTVYSSLKIDPDKENMSPIGRPIKIVEGGQAIAELLG